MLRRLIDKQSRLFKKKDLQEAIPNALDLYNRYLNHRSIQEFMLRQEKFKSKRNARFMPAMMLMPGMEEEYIRYCEQKTKETRDYYADRISVLKPHTTVQHYKAKSTFGKERVSTVSQPFQLQGRYVYDFDTGKTTRSGDIKKRTIGDSYAVEGSTMWYMPNDFVRDRKNKKLVLRIINTKSS